jgi:5-methylcytosine-specific restriction endonuclease McrA
MRLEVLKRDNNKCTKCGKTEGLETHHIKPIKVLLKEFQELGIDFNRNHEHFHNIDNLITLCVKCHRQEEKV